MDYALCTTYGYGHLTMKSLCFPSTLRTTKLEFNLSHSSHLLYSGFTQHLPGTKPVSPVIRAVDKSASPSSDGKRGGKILRGAVGASLVLACALGVFSWSCNLKPTAIAGPPTLTSKKATTEPATQVLGAKYALDSFLEVSKILTSDEVLPLMESTNLPRKPSTADIWTAKTEAVRIIKSGNTSKAMASLQKAYKECEGQPEQQYEVDMAIVEILISQGKYEEALKRGCLKSDVPVSKSDTRFYLYKALVHTMLDNNKEAKKWWNSYIDTVGKGLTLLPKPI